MMIPATVTFLTFMISSKKSDCFPKYVCKAVFLADGLLIFEEILEIFFLSSSQSEYLGIFLFTFSAVIFYLALFFETTEIKKSYGLSCNSNCKKNIFYLVLFLILQADSYLIQTVFDYLTGNHHAFQDLLEAYSHFPLAVAGLFLSFFYNIVPFFGEEYGWRGFLQPYMQKQFGMQKGVIFTGIIWGIWHFPMNLFYYRSSSIFADMAGQIFFCISIGIFMGYVYLKTKNIWICVAIHFLNNNMIAVLYPSALESTSSNSVTELLISTISILLVYAVFLRTSVFQDKLIIDSFLLPRNCSESLQVHREDTNFR